MGFLTHTMAFALYVWTLLPLRSAGRQRIHPDVKMC